jgi:serine/threonine-protein kinase
METPKKIGRYEVVAELGRGAMGTVYRAKDPAMDREVALKTVIAVALASAQGSEFRERFYREAKAAGRLAHPGIVAVFDVGEDEGLPFLVMEFVNGQTLEAAVKKGERLTLERVCEIGQQIADAIGYAHKQGVIHRDIKPANILLTSTDAHGIERPKITDFGVAKLAAGQITTTGQMLGTPAYMPPEQFTGAQVDGRADIFSLGVILYWMATGEQPFHGETMTAVSYKVVHTEPVPPRKLNPSIPEDLDFIIMKCLAKSPVDRYQTGEELARDLAGLRAQGKPDMQRTAFLHPQTDTTATIDVRLTTDQARVPTVVATVPVAGSADSTVRSPRPSQPNRFVLPAVIGTAVVLFGGWFVLRNKNEAKPPVAQVSATAPIVAANPPAPAPAPPVEKNPEAPKPPVTAAAVAEKKPEKKVSTAAVPAPPPKAVSTSPLKAAEPAPVDFDPKTLNPKENSRLIIDATRMPSNLDFTIEMNGKLYFRRSVAGNKQQYEDLFVPPGVQEFHAIARNSETQKASNTVSDEFKAKKKKTLKIELRLQGRDASAGMPQDLYPTAQVVLTLK